jgi:hypothetical protein
MDCLLERLVDPPGKEGTIRYRGDFVLVYQEMVEMAANLTLTRTSSLITPVDLYVNATVVGDMGNSSVAVFSPFQLQAAVTGTLVKRDATTSLVAFTLALNAPYAIWNIQGQPTSFPNRALPPLAQVCIYFVDGAWLLPAELSVSPAMHRDFRAALIPVVCW